MLINEVCKECGLTKKAIDYYEKCGLLHPKYSVNGYRHFDESDLTRLKEIAVLRKLDICVADVKLILESEDKRGTLAKYRAKKDIERHQVMAQYECLNYLLATEDAISEVFNEIERKLDPVTLIKDRLLQAFPGTYGKYLHLHFGRFLDEKIDSPEKEMAYSTIIGFLDSINNLDFPQELEEYFAETLSYLDNGDLEKMDESINDAIDNYSIFMETNKDNINQYLSVRESAEYKESMAYKMQQTILKFQSANGYYDVFIPNLEILSPSYKAYLEKLKRLNEQFLRDYPQAKDMYKKQE